MVMRGLIAAALLVISCNFAFADNLDSEMDFKIYDAKVYEQCPTCPSHVEIQADGVITEDTPEKFRQFLAGKNIPPGSDVYFTSGGGKLDPALELGRIIRKEGFNTVVGAHQQVSDEAKRVLAQYGVPLITDVPFFAPGVEESGDGWIVSISHIRWPSYCASACTFAFLGGVRRFVGVPSVYAVHQFNWECDDKEMKQQKICVDPVYSSSKSQKQSADLAVYLEEMGISEKFLQDMVKAEPANLRWLMGENLKKYGIESGLGGDLPPTDRRVNF